MKSHNHGLNFCSICGDNSFYNQATNECEKCTTNSICFLGSSQKYTGIKNEINKFNISNYPTLYDETITKK